MVLLFHFSIHDVLPALAFAVSVQTDQTNQGQSKESTYLMWERRQMI